MKRGQSNSILQYLKRKHSGNEEFESSKNKSYSIELLKLVGNLNELVADVVLDNAPKGNQLVIPSIQKEIVNAGAKETLNVIMNGFKDDFFGLLVDECEDIAHKKQMSVVVRYVDKLGIVKERFVGVVPVEDTSSLSLKAGLESLLSEHNLNLSMVRSQGCNGASNMHNKFNELKTLILNENKCAYFIHCVSHQLHLILVALARDHNDIENLFDEISKLSNVVGASCKRHDALHEEQVQRVKEALSNEEIDIRWGSHYKSVMNVRIMFDSIMDVLEFIEIEGETSTIRNDAISRIAYLSTFDFSFTLHLMMDILGTTYRLSQALQRKYQNIENIVSFVRTTKLLLEKMRKDGWDSLLETTRAFCKERNIPIPNMNEKWTPRGRPRRNAQGRTYEFHYRVEVFYTIVDLHLEELKCRFNKTNIELLTCISCLSPRDRFSAFDQFKLVKLVQFYPYDFSSYEIMILEHQLANYLLDVQSQDTFQELKGLDDLCKAMVETKKDITYPLVFRLLKLALILPMSSSTIERTFSSMNIVKDCLRNRTCDHFLNDCLVCYIEKDVFDSISNDYHLSFSKHET